MKSWCSWVNFNLSQFWHIENTWDWDYLWSIKLSMTCVITLFVELILLYKSCHCTNLWMSNPDEINQRSSNFQKKHKIFSMFLKIVWDWFYFKSINFSETNAITTFVHLFEFYKKCHCDSSWKVDAEKIISISVNFDILKLPEIEIIF
jgi:hypothetical protein